ncbi:MAG: hypothetical protein EP319_06395 [Deltaproteobacteria bacterium]|nr:MAG: hypothetical protein EP319_06395 [Deltaproteobacteria bacterium]
MIDKKAEGLYWFSKYIALDDEVYSQEDLDTYLELALKHPEFFETEVWLSRTDEKARNRSMELIENFNNGVYEGEFEAVIYHLYESYKKWEDL